jgi:hypothetical protein
MNPIDENEQSQSNTAAQVKRGWSVERKVNLVLIVFLAALGAGMYLWKMSTERVLVDKVSLSEAKQVQVRAEVVNQARQLNYQSTEEALRRFSVPLAWAIRREVMANNLDQVDQYFTDLIQVPGIESAVYATPDGKVMVATNSKQLTAPFFSFYPAEYLKARNVRVEQVANGNWQAIIPILGLNQDMGVVVLEVKPAAYPLR